MRWRICWEEVEADGRNTIEKLSKTERLQAQPIHASYLPLRCKRFKTDYYHATPKQREFIDAVATHEYQLMKAHEKGLSRASVPPFMGMKRSERSNNMPAW